MEVALLERTIACLGRGALTVTSFDKFGTTAAVEPGNIEQLIAVVPEDRPDPCPQPWRVLDECWPSDKEDVTPPCEPGVLGVAWPCLPLLGRAARSIVLRRPLRDPKAAGGKDGKTETQSGASTAAAQGGGAGGGVPAPPPPPRAAAASALVLVNPQAYTAWNLRKEWVSQQLESETSGSLPHRLALLTGELRLTDVVLAATKKVPGDVWVHRRWLFARLSDSLFQQLDTDHWLCAEAGACGRLAGAWLAWELHTCARAAASYPRNYYAWTHRGALFRAALAFMLRLAGARPHGATIQSFIEGLGRGLHPALASAVAGSGMGEGAAALLSALAQPPTPQDSSPSAALAHLDACLCAFVLADAALTAARLRGVHTDYSAWTHRHVTLANARAGLGDASTALPVASALVSSLTRAEARFVAAQAPQPGRGTSTADGDGGRTWSRLHEASAAAAAGAPELAAAPAFVDAALQAYETHALGLPL